MIWWWVCHIEIFQAWDWSVLADNEGESCLISLLCCFCRRLFTTCWLIHPYEWFSIINMRTKTVKTLTSDKSFVLFVQILNILLLIIITVFYSCFTRNLWKSVLLLFLRTLLFMWYEPPVVIFSSMMFDAIILKKNWKKKLIG